MTLTTRPLGSGRQSANVEPGPAEPPEPPNAPMQSNQADAIIWLAAGLLGALGLGGYIYWAVNGGLVKDGNWIGVDFHVYYQVAQVLRRGQDIYSAGISPPYVYPPLLAALVVPLSLLPVGPATIAWKILQHLCLLGAGILLLSLIPPRIRPLGGGLLLLGGLTVVVQDEIQVGESNSLVLLLVAGTLWLVARDRHTGGGEQTFSASEVGAGLLLGLAAGIKVLPVLLVVYFWVRGPRTVAAVATAFFVALQLVLFLVTPSTATYWLIQFPSLLGQAFPSTDNQSLNSFFSRAFLPGDPAFPSPQIASGDAARSVLTWAANLLVLALAAWVLVLSARRTGTAAGRSPFGSAVRFLLEVGLVLLTTHLVSGSTWLHHLVDLSVPMLGLLAAWWLSVAGGSAVRPGRTLALGAIGGLVFAVLLQRPGDWMIAANAVVTAPLVTLFASSSAMWVVVALWCLVAYALLRHSPSPAPA